MQWRHNGYSYCTVCTRRGATIKHVWNVTLITEIQAVPCRRDGGGELVQITGARRSGRGPEYVAYAFVFLGSNIICRLYKLTLSD